MKAEQIVHLGMMNSFNYITGKATIEQIISFKVPAFAHDPDDELRADLLDHLIYYFKEKELFEEVSELNRVKSRIMIDQNFAKSFENKLTEFLDVPHCECDMPKVLEYKYNSTCGNCGNRI